MPLERFKAFEYLVRVTLAADITSFRFPMLYECLGFLGRDSRLALLEEILAWRLSQKPNPLHEDDLSTGFSIPKLQAMVRRISVGCWTLTEYLLQVPPFGEYVQPLFKRLLRDELKSEIHKPPHAENGLGMRLEKIGALFLLDQLDLELLIFAFLFRDPTWGYNLEIYYTVAKANLARKVVESGKFSPEKAWAEMLGMPWEKVKELLSPSSPLLRLGFLNRKLELAPELRDYLENGGHVDWFRQGYFQLHKGKPLPLEAYPWAQKGCEGLVEELLIRRRKNPIHILVHGPKGPEKIDFALSLGAATDRETLVVGSSNRSAPGKEAGEEESLRFLARALSIASRLNECRNCLFVIEPLDLIFAPKNGKKFVSLMKQTKFPLLWIANHLDPDTLSNLSHFDHVFEFPCPQEE